MSFYFIFRIEYQVYLIKSIFLKKILGKLIHTKTCKNCPHGFVNNEDQKKSHILKLKWKLLHRTFYPNIFSMYFMCSKLKTFKHSNILTQNPCKIQTLSQIRFSGLNIKNQKIEFGKKVTCYTDPVLKWQKKLSYGKQIHLFPY